MEGMNYSISDLAAVANGGSGFGNNSFWIIILFLLVFNGGWNRGGNYGAGDFGQYATAASQQEILFGQRFSNLDNKIDRIGNGIADATFALNNSITAATANLGTAIATEGRSTQGMVADVRYDMANMAAGINANIDHKFAALEKSQLEQRIAEQASQINQLQLQAQLCGIPRVNNAAWGTYPYTQPACCGCGCN